MKKNTLLFIISLFSSLTIFAQKKFSLEILHENKNTSIRGLSVVTDKIIWVSGSNGTVGRSVDGGETWKWYQVEGFEKNDFRDIEAFDAQTAVIMAIGEPAFILKTYNGGESWKKVYENNQPGMFLDAMEFWNDHSGIVIGDAIDGKMFIARTFDGGQKWTALKPELLPTVDTGEACFAASGTNIRALDRDEACFITGGTQSRFFFRDKAIKLPLLQGSGTTGANSIAIRDKHKRKGSKVFIVVGGDFTRDTLRTGNCAITRDGGITWTEPQTPPFGYRSCVEYITKKQVICCGTSGVDISTDGGMNWMNISSRSFHVVRKAKDGKTVFLAGKDGVIGKLKIQK
ncbi:MAG TPA: YCF48-related protein [Parasegetibacter sp.]